MSILKSYLSQGYPQGSMSIFLTQALFNFGFFGFKSLVILYAIDFYALKESEAINIFATLMTLSYATSLVGGFLADKLIGPQNTLLIGGVLSSLGVGLLIFPLNTNVFFALTLLSLGSGCFKPNLSTLLSLLFKDPQDSHKDSAFTILYVAMNLGNFLGPIFCSLASHYYGWISGFAAIVVSFMTGTYLLFRQMRHLKDLVRTTTFIQSLQAVSILVASGGALYFLFTYRNYFDGLMGIIMVISLICFGTIFYKSTHQEREGLIKTIPYIFLFAFFCALFEQAGSSIMIFFERVVDRQMLGFILPSSSLLSFDPIFVLVLGLLIPLLSKNYLKKSYKIDGLTKFGIGFLFIGFSFGVLALGSTLSQIPITITWILVAILFQTFGELFIIPVGFASISKFAPRRYLSLMMSLWLMAISYGHYLAGILAQFSLNPTKDGPKENLDIYHQFFFHLSLVSLGLAFVLIMNTIKNYYRKK
jgi:POT family proton-dependent oligopeptide transporter